MHEKQNCGCVRAGVRACGVGSGAGRTLDKIKKSGVITMGYMAGSVPFSSKNEKGQPQGYSVDLCREIASGIREQLKMPAIETRWVELTIQNRLEAVRSGKVDIECRTPRPGHCRGRLRWTSA